MNQKLTLLKKAYALIDSETPLKTDCGRLCGKACCGKNAVGNTENAGMMLLPGEENLCVDSHFSTHTGDDGLMLVCDGNCKRNIRPFSCRIFPYYARISPDGRISLRTDPRAFNICPVAQRKKGTRHSVYFHRSAVKAVRVLLKDEDFKRELMKTSDFCDSLYSFYRKMLKEV